MEHLVQQLSIQYDKTITDEAMCYLRTWTLTRNYEPGLAEIHDLFAAFLTDLSPRQRQITPSTIQDSTVFLLEDDDDEWNTYQ
jgi:hypothetical protein